MNQIHKWLNRQIKEVTWEANTYEPKKLRIEKTVYPNGVPTISPNTGEEWYGLIDNLKTKK